MEHRVRHPALCNVDQRVLATFCPVIASLSSLSGRCLVFMGDYLGRDHDKLAARFAIDLSFARTTVQ